MGKKITRKQLQQLVESKVNEAWYNNWGDFKKGARNTAIGGAAALSAASCSPNMATPDNDYDRANIERQTMFGGLASGEYENWCEYYQRDPNDYTNKEAFDDFCNFMQGQKEQGEDVSYYQRILKGEFNTNMLKECYCIASSKRNKRKSNLSRIINESIKKVLEENEECEYNPWMNGDASWIAGSYDIPYGFHVEIDPSMSTVAIDGESEENSYFLQGDEADDLIRQIAQHWSSGDMTQEEAVNDIIQGLF